MKRFLPLLLLTLLLLTATACGEPEAHIHTWDVWQQESAPTCSSVGRENRTCTTCGKVESRLLPATEHTYSDEWASNSQSHWHPSTCGHPFVPYPHVWDNGTVTVAPDCENEGLMTYTCTDCGYTREETIAPDDANHPPHTEEWSYSGAYHWRESSCSHPIEVADWGKHTYGEDGLCTACSAPMAAFTFTLNRDGASYTLTGYAAEEALAFTDVLIPATYRGLPVTAIGKNALQALTGAVSVIIPDSITSIGEGAFAGNQTLTSVTFGYNAILSTLEKGAFHDCTALTAIQIPASVTKIGASVFSGCTALSSVTFAEGAQLTFLGDYAFMDCTALSTISLPDPLTYIGMGAFFDCSNLVTVFLNETSRLEVIDIFAFNSCAKLSSFTVTSHVTEIGFSAFIGCDSLTDVTNLSDLPIEAGSEDFGMVAYHATEVK